MTNVLIVEDEPAISDMERDFLEGAGYNLFNNIFSIHRVRNRII